MNKNAIKNFAIWARNKLIADVVYQAGLLGVTEKGIAQPLPQSTGDVQFFDIGTKDYITLRGDAIRQRQAFVDAIREKEKEIGLREAFRFVVEKVAYTWFNRMIAIRFMEVNDYLPGHIRVLSSENPQKAEPDMVTTPFDTDLAFTAADREEIARLRDENKLDQLFRMLFICQCRKLHEVLPVLFEEGGTGHRDSYLELLLTISFTDRDGVLWHLVHDISEDDFDVSKEGQVAIIGWLYQYYNTEPKKEVFANLDKKIKIDKDHIPAATQLFTPDWIVRYMVENSLGRLWVEGHPDEALQATWRYYLPEAEQEPEVAVQLAEIRKQSATLKPEDILVIDPCMGSGHILVYLFDVLMQIYTTQGWTARDAVESIITKNLWGLDIDDRAAQLAYFAVMMKAREYDRRFLTRGLAPHVMAIQESNDIDRGHLRFLGNGLSDLERNNARTQMEALLDEFIDAKEYGSILRPEVYDWEALRRFVRMTAPERQVSLEEAGLEGTQEQLLEIIEQGQALAQSYHAAMTNPPYMNPNNMTGLHAYIKNHFPNSKADLFAVFIERCHELLLPNGYQGMITMHGWMFLASYESLRISLRSISTINMAHLGARAFDDISGEVVQTTAFVMQNARIPQYRGVYRRLVEPGSERGKENLFLSGGSSFITTQDTFSKIPGSPVAYWISNAVKRLFASPLLGNTFSARVGIQTNNNDLFLKYWFEVPFATMSHDQTGYISTIKWYPHPKGGLYRKWYGNYEYVVNLLDNAHDMEEFSGKRFNLQPYFRNGLSWTHTTTGRFSCRRVFRNHVPNLESPVMYIDDEATLHYVMALLNSEVANMLLAIMNTGFHYHVANILSIPYINAEIDNVELLTTDCIQISRADWDSFEISWDFQRHPLLPSPIEEPTQRLFAQLFVEGIPDYQLSQVFACWREICESRFQQLKANEEELNRIFIEIYGLQDELTPEVAEEDVTVRRADLGRDIRSLVSYAVGCMLGRYSLDVPGLAYAGGEWDASKYVTYQPDTDNCLVIPPEDYGMKDDIVNRFVDFIRVAYGETYLEENLTFIANALGTKGDTSRERIRNYFLHDFIKDHIRIYQKRPIYWLFDSGKQDGFKALVYMHRWTADTVGNMRVEYLHRLQRLYESEITRMQEIIDNSADVRESNRARVRLEKLRKRLQETRDYDQRIAHVALSRVAIDLDDGVKVNYDKVQQGPNGENLGILAKL